jgi:hypothetical protein
MKFSAYSAADLNGVVHSVVYYLDEYERHTAYVERDIERVRTIGLTETTTCNNVGFDKPFVRDAHASRDLSRVTCLACASSLERLLLEFEKERRR